MDEKQLLNEIAYYPSYINRHQTHWNPNFKQKVFVKPHFNPSSQFRYVKNATQSSSTSAVIKPVQNTSIKVLINPNFKQPNVHINPHFNANNANRTILINPKILNTPQSLQLQETVQSNSTRSNCIFESKNQNNFSTRNRRLSIRSQYKIVKSSCLEQNELTLPKTDVNVKLIKKPLTNTNIVAMSSFSPNLTTRKRRLSIRSKYKIVKSSSTNQLKSPLITPRKRTTSIHSKYKIVQNCTDTPKTKSINNKYKIDRRNITIRNKSQIKKKVLSNGISDILRKNLFKNHMTWKKKLVINQFKSNNTRLTNISGILYKKTQTKLQKLQPTQKLNSKLKKHIFIKEQVFTPNKILRKSLVKERTSNKFTKNKNTSIFATENISRKSKQKDRNKLQKNNIPCPVYRRYGQCRRKDAGRCRFLHNPNQIFLCKKFLQGACVDKDCLLSHKVSLEKMPTCKYFLEGCCTKNDCPYLHVKINPKADICRKFLEGFCHKGIECNLRHQFLCPDFERNGKCLKRKCIYPHKMKCDKESPKAEEKYKKEIDIITPPVIEQLQIESKRYYIESKTENKITTETEDKQAKYVVNNENISDSPSEEIFYKRPQLGELPAFIPFN